LKTPGWDRADSGVGSQILFYTKELRSIFVLYLQFFFIHFFAIDVLAIKHFLTDGLPSSESNPAVYVPILLRGGSHRTPEGFSALKYRHICDLACLPDRRFTI
jgi:hypothetical protein